MPVLWIVNHHAIAPGENGGTRHYSLAEACAEAGFTPCIVASATNYQTGASRVDAHRTEQVGRVTFLWLRQAVQGKGNLRRLGGMLAFASLILRGVPLKHLPRPDIIVGSSPHLFAAFAAHLLARRLRVPFVLEVRDLWPESLMELGNMKSWHPLICLMRLMATRLYRRADRIVTLLPDSAPFFVSYGAKAEHIHVIPNGIDTHLMVMPESVPTSKHFTILYAGAHGIPNPLKTLVRAAARLKDEPALRVRLVGEGMCKAELMDYAKEIGASNVTFEPPVPKHAMPALLASADAGYIEYHDLPLYRWGVSPNKLFDYLLAAKPVLYGVNVATNPVRTANAGFVLPPKDTDMLVNTIRLLMRMTPAERAAMGERGRAHVLAHYDMQKLGAQFAAMLKGAL